MSTLDTLPLRLRPDTVIRVSPVITTNEYGAQVRTYGTTGLSMRVKLQPEGGSELNDARNQESLAMRMYGVEPVAADDRIIWPSQGLTFDAIGPGRPQPSPRGGIHHYVSSLRRVIG